MWIQQNWRLTPERVAIHQSSATAVLADMHLGYVAARRGDGEAVPHFGEAERLDYLTELFQQLQIKHVVVAGDLVESPRHGLPVVRDWATQLEELHISLHLTPGNHDAGLQDVPGLQVHHEGFAIGDWLVLHDAPVNDTRCMIHGHLHPTIRSAAAVGEAACYLTTSNRLLLPAWCDHAAGVSVQSLTDWKDADCHAIVNDQVVALGNVAALSQKLRRRPRPFRIGFGLTT
ncbi:MAG: metallophosphoesterase [Gemmatales bacterium]